MNAAQPSADFLDAMVAAFIAAMDTPKMGLFIGNPSLTVATVLADLTALPPVYTGYAEKAMTAGAVRHNAAGDRLQPYNGVTWQPTGPLTAPPAIVSGYYIQVQAGVGPASTLSWAEYFDTPWIVADEFAAITLIYEALLQAAAVWGGLCTTC